MLVLVRCDDDKIETDRAIERSSNVEISLRATDVGFADD